jgi:hypothetical protein
VPAGPATAGAVATVLLIGWQYSAQPGLLKRRPAGTAVACAALGFLAYFSGFSSQASAAALVADPAAIYFTLAMSAWMAFVGAPAKDLPDIAGDAAAGRRTLPVRWGEPVTRHLIAGAAVAIMIAIITAAQHSPGHRRDHRRADQPEPGVHREPAAPPPAVPRLYDHPVRDEHLLTHGLSDPLTVHRFARPGPPSVAVGETQPPH